MKTVEASAALTGANNAVAPRADRHLPGEAAIWVFVLGDMTMFAAFFGQFLCDRARQPALFVQSALQLDASIGAINTLVLLSGSLFVALGVEAVRRQQRVLAQRLFAMTLLCALIFLADKVIEYRSKFVHGYFPNSNDFFTYYYLYTAIHAVHLLIGMCFLVRMWQLSRRTADADAIRFIEIGATYWHLVDLLWIVLFALLYLLV